jgi:small basic protein
VKVKHKKRLIKFGLPIAIILAIIVGILSFPNVTGSYSPYTSLGIIYFFND